MEVFFGWVNKKNILYYESTMMNKSLSDCICAFKIKKKKLSETTYRFTTWNCTFRTRKPLQMVLVVIKYLFKLVLFGEKEHWWWRIWSNQNKVEDRKKNNKKWNTSAICFEQHKIPQHSWEKNNKKIRWTNLRLMHLPIALLHTIWLLRNSSPGHEDFVCRNKQNTWTSLEYKIGRRFWNLQTRRRSVAMVKKKKQHGLFEQSLSWTHTQVGFFFFFFTNQRIEQK